MATAIFDTEPYPNLECLLIIPTVIYPDSSWLDRLRVQCVKHNWNGRAPWVVYGGGCLG